MHELGPDAPVLSLSVSVQSPLGERPAFHLDDHRATVLLSDGVGWSELVREATSVSLFTDRLYDHESLLHPVLSGTFAVVNRWLGRDVFHGGVIDVGGRAWVVVGDKGMGKSTLVASLALRGVGILSDDLAVVAWDTVHAGPAFADLRPDAASHLGVGRDLGVLGARRRARFDVAQASASLPIAGWVTLAWGDTTTVELVPLASRMDVLLRNQAVLLRPQDPTTFLQHLSLPMYRLTRPQRWDCQDAALDLLLDATR